jgi:hypothetical protein
MEVKEVEAAVLAADTSQTLYALHADTRQHFTPLSLFQEACAQNANAPAAVWTGSFHARSAIRRGH